MNTVRPEKTAFTTNVTCCARCKGRHQGMIFRPILNPPVEFEFYAICPTTNQPVMMAAGAEGFFQERIPE